MELKLVELILTTKEFSEKSEKYYIYLEFDFCFEEVYLHIRSRVKHEYIESRKLHLKNATEENISEIIKSIENYRG